MNKKDLYYYAFILKKHVEVVKPRHGDTFFTFYFKNVSITFMTKYGHDIVLLFDGVEAISAISLEEIAYLVQFLYDSMGRISTLIEHEVMLNKVFNFLDDI